MGGEESRRWRADHEAQGRYEASNSGDMHELEIYTDMILLEVGALLPLFFLNFCFVCLEEILGDRRCLVIYLFFNFWFVCAIVNVYVYRTKHPRRIWMARVLSFREPS